MAGSEATASDVPPAQELLALAVDLAAAAGAVLLEHYGQVTGVGTKTTVTDPVSDADRASEELLTGRILGLRPDDAVLGEEGADRPGSSGLRWVLDPLDGTVNYLYGHPGWCVSVACEDRDGALVGVVHDPLRGETFSAARGLGARLHGAGKGSAVLSCNDPVPLDRALVATGFAYDRAHRARQAAVVADLLGRVRDIRRMGSAALDACSVAAGRVDAYYEDSTAPWDVAAGALIAREAGAVATPLGGGLLTAGATLHAELEAILSRLR